MISTLGLASGQGKTTVALMLCGYLGRMGILVLFIDAEPQSSLTDFLGVKIKKNMPTLLEVITKPEEKLSAIDAITTVPDNLEGLIVYNSNLYLIPADDGLESANYKLAASGMSLFALRSRIAPLKNEFGAIIIDPPPERSHLAQSALGAADKWLIPAEASTKGVQSLVRTLGLINEFKTALPESELLGVIPFRAMTAEVGTNLMLPHLLESDVYKQAIDQRVSPTDLGSSQLEYAIEQIYLRLKASLSSKYKELVV